MSYHVDIVKNDWAAGLQYPLATFKLDDAGNVSVDTRRPDGWQDLLHEITSSPDPGNALSGLHMKMNGSYLFATPLHEDADCPFHGQPVYLEGHEASGASRAIPA
jgi:hypothetical protein